MDNSLKFQSYVFLTSIYGGLLFGFVYDLYKMFRYFLKPNKIATIIEDIIFWVIVTVIVFFILIRSTWGELRGYIFLGLFMGAFLYFKKISRIIYPILIKIFKCIACIFKKIFFILSIPFKQLRRTIKPVAKKIGKLNKISIKMIHDTRKYISIISKKK